MIYLYGSVENCFNSFYAFRGYAKPKDIVRYSEAYNGYQRNLNDEHTNAIAQYFRDGINVFSPEVILAYSVENWWDEQFNPTFHGGAWHGGGISPIDFLVNNNGVSKQRKVILKDELGIQVERLSTNFGKNINLARISLPDDLPIRPFRRIDGNHRLEAMSLIEGQKAEYQIPICIVFLKADFFEGQTDDDINTVKTETMIFHNINSKQIPLTPEEILRAIIENENMFFDNELKDDPSFGLEYYLTRKLLNEVNLENYRYINTYIAKTKYTFFVNLFRCLKEYSPEFINDTSYKTLIMQFPDIETALAESHEILAHNNISVIGAMAYYRVAGPKKYPYFVQWASKNHLGDVKNVRIDDILGIYNKIYENTPKKIFLARWYPDAENPEHTNAEYRLQAIRNAIKSYDPKLELVDMGTRTAGTFSIREAINQELPISDVFIADLTGARPNVMIEVGIALKNIPEGRVLFYFHPTEGIPSVPFDLSGYQYFLINDSRDIDEKVVPALRNILENLRKGE
jgi:hypothetical protein